MRERAFLLALEEDRWRIAAVNGSSTQLRELAFPAGGDGLAEMGELVELLEAMGYGGQEVCLGLPSDMVFSAEVYCHDLPRRQRGSAMLYRLEEQLPLEAEGLSADFTRPAAGRSFAVAVETDGVAGILEGLTEAGLLVASVVPTALLACWQISQELDQPAGYIILAGQDTAEILYVEDGGPRSWHTISSGPDQVLQCLRMDMLNRPISPTKPGALTTGPGAQAVCKQLQAELDTTVVDGNSNSVEVAALAAAESLAGKPGGWVNLRTGRLATRNGWGGLGKLAGVTVGLVAAFLLALSTALLARAHAYGNLAEDFHAEKQSVYASVYPNSPVPASIATRLESEYRRHSGVSGLSGEIPAQMSCLEVLRRMTAALPGSVRMRVLQLRISGRQVMLEGQARSHGDAEIVARALRAQGFEVESPKSEHMPEGGVSFTLAGKDGLPGLLREGAANE